MTDLPAGTPLVCSDERHQAKVTALQAEIATMTDVARSNRRHSQTIVPELEKAEAAIARIRALHAPTANLSWPAFSCTCEPVSTHTRACSQCQRCHPCPTLRALDGTA